MSAKERKLMVLFYSIFSLGVLSILGTFYYAFCYQANRIQKSVSCNNVRTPKKDDLIFDNYYVICDNNKSYEIGFELYSKLIEGNDYIINFNELGGIYSINSQNK